MVIKDVFDNARRLGLPDKHLGFQWSVMFDIEQDLIKKGCKRRDLSEELDKKLIELQNDNYLKEYNFFTCFKSATYGRL